MKHLLLALLLTISTTTANAECTTDNVGLYVGLAVGATVGAAAGVAYIASLPVTGTVAAGATALTILKPGVIAGIVGGHAIFPAYIGAYLGWVYDEVTTECRWS